eukprot:1027619-Ditylum_brightwellii.AAC.1
MKQVEGGKSPTHLHLPNTPTHARLKNPYVASKKPMNANTDVPEVHGIPSMPRFVVPYAAARNPYASACVTHTSQQKVSKHPNTASTDGIDFDTPLLPDST